LVAHLADSGGGYGDSDRMASETLLTPRLRLEPWSDAHTEMLVRLGSTPSVTRYIGAGSTWPADRSIEVAQRNRDHWREHGFGWRAAIRLDSGEAIGFTALNFAGEGSGVDADEYEIGWWLDPSAWRQGFAREGALAVCEEAFTQVGAPSLVARIQPGNGPSLGQRRSDSSGNPRARGGGRSDRRPAADRGAVAPARSGRPWGVTCGSTPLGAATPGGRDWRAAAPRC